VASVFAEADEATIHFEQSTMGERAGQLDFDFLFHSPAGPAIDLAPP
jgi:hypothetical protein